MARLTIQQSRVLELNLEIQPFSDAKTTKSELCVVAFTETLANLESKSKTRERAKLQKNI